MAAGWRLAGPAGASHKASKAGAQVAGFPGVWELLAVQIGYPQILTAITGRTAIFPGGKWALCRGTSPGLAVDAAFPAEAHVARDTR